jgi:RNA polymerase sigma-70 factor (ECF subfamily)
MCELTEIEAFPLERRHNSLKETEDAECTVGTEVLSFCEIYRAYFDFVWASSRYLGVEESELDDVIQDVFVAIYRRINTLQNPDSLRGWIYGVTRRIVSTYRRSKRTALIHVNTAPIEPTMVLDEVATPHQQIERFEQLDFLRQLLAELDAAKREVIELAELREMRAPEIATLLDVPLNTVYSRLRSARRELDEVFRRYQARYSRYEAVVVNFN